MPDDTAPVPFDPKSLIDTVKERVKAVYVALIPDEAWQAMVKKEVDWFLNPPVERDQYGNTVYRPAVPGSLTALVRTALGEIAQQQIKEFFAQPAWKVEYNDAATGRIPSAIAALVDQHMPEILRSLFGNALANVLSRVDMHVGNLNVSNAQINSRF